jgi:ribosomal-protein-alanine N-acetyltransferase
MTMLLRPLPRGDRAALAALHAACFPEDPWDGAALATVLGMPGAGGRLATAESGAALGLIIDQRVGEDAEILTLGVVPASRRQGIARTLLSDLFRRARDGGALRVVLEVAADNEAARALYLSMGFARDGLRRAYYRRPNGPSIDAWRLSRTLAVSKSF